MHKLKVKHLRAIAYWFLIPVLDLEQLDDRRALEHVEISRLVPFDSPAIAWLVRQDRLSHRFLWSKIESNQNRLIRLLVTKVFSSLSGDRS